MRTPFLKEPLPAPWWAFIYTLHHKMWCELHYGPTWYRRNFKKLQWSAEGYKTFGLLDFIVLAPLTVFVFYLITKLVKELLIPSYLQ